MRLQMFAYVYASSFYKFPFTLKHYQLLQKYLAQNNVNSFVSHRNWYCHTIYQQVVVYAGELFIGMNFDTMIYMYLSLKPQLSMKNVDFSRG